MNTDKIGTIVGFKKEINNMKSFFKKNLGFPGSSITPKELIVRIQESQEDIQNKKVFTLNDAKKQVKTWE